MIRLLWLLLAISWASFNFAQEPRFIQHDLGDAYSSLTVNVMLQDSRAMLWLGSNSGLARYDGISLRLEEIDSITSHKVTALAEDHLNQIWVGTEAGDIFYLDQARQVHRFDIEEGHPKKPISAITEDVSGQLWFSTYGEGVYVYSDKRLYNFNSDDGLSGNDIYTMILAEDDEVWLGTDDGISICSFRHELKTVRKLGLSDGLPDQIITALKADAAGNVYIGTFESGLVFYNRKTKTITVPFPNPGMDEITAIEIFDGRELWMGTRSSGVWRYNMGDYFARRIENLQALKAKNITDILTDVEGNIWVTMNEGGLISGFRPFESVVTDADVIQTMFCDHKDRVWIGSKNGLFFLEQSKPEQIRTVKVNTPIQLNITDILEDHFNQLWIATLDKGLFIFDPENNKLTSIGSIIERGGITIMSMGMTAEKIWLATLEGVVSYPANSNILHDRHSFQLLKDQWQSNLHFVFQVYVDSKDKTWFATDGNGVYCDEGDKIVQYAGNDSIHIRTVYSIAEDHRGHMWFNTPDQGLIEFDGQNYKPLNVAQGLGNLSITSISSSGTGDMVLVHSRGIDIMDPDRRHFMYYSDVIGAKNIEPGLNAIALDNEHNVYIGCKNLIYKYFSTRHKLSFDPRTQLTKVSVFEVPVDFAHKHHFTHAENYLTFDYVGLWYTSPVSVKYLYKLEGYDLQWKESKDNVASYSHLSPGDYTFYVKASENNSFFDEPVASYTFTIAKPFWLEAWFIGFIAIASGGLLWWLVKSRERHSERQAMLKKEMVESQLSAVKAQINPHFLFNSFNTLITIIDENAMHPEVAIEYVENLSDFYRSILQYREQSSISLEEEFGLVRNFAYLLEKRYGTNFRLHVEGLKQEAFILPLTLQILVENAVKHNVISEQRPLDVFITIDEDEYVSVCNNLQPKAKPDPSTQFGLSSIIKQYQLLTDRKVIVENGPKVFRVRIPLMKRIGT